MFFFNSSSQTCWKARWCLAWAQGEQSKWRLPSTYKKWSYFLQKLANEARNKDNSEGHPSRQTGMLPLTSSRESSGWQMILAWGLISHSCHSTDTGATSAKNAAFSRRQRAAGLSLEESALRRSCRQPITGLPADRLLLLLLGWDWKCVYIFVQLMLPNTFNCLDIFKPIKAARPLSRVWFCVSIISVYDTPQSSRGHAHSSILNFQICIFPSNTHKLQPQLVPQHWLTKLARLHLPWCLLARNGETLYPNWYRDVLEVKSYLSMESVR